MDLMNNEQLGRELRRMYDSGEKVTYPHVHEYGLKKWMEQMVRESRWSYSAGDGRLMINPPYPVDYIKVTIKV